MGPTCPPIAAAHELNDCLWLSGLGSSDVACFLARDREAHAYLWSFMAFDLISLDTTAENTLLELHHIFELLLPLLHQMDSWLTSVFLQLAGLSEQN